MVSKKKCLIVRNGALGDTLVALPAIFAFRKQFPEIEIHFMGNASWFDLVRPLGLVDFLLDSDDRSLLRYYSESQDILWDDFKYGLVWSKTQDSFVQNLQTNIEVCSVHPLFPDESFPLGSNGSSSPSSEEGIGQHLYAILSSFEKQFNGEKHPEQARSLFPQFGETLCKLQVHMRQVFRPFADSRKARHLLHPGAGGKSKVWPYWVELIQHLLKSNDSEKIGILQGPADQSIVGDLLSQLNHSSNPNGILNRIEVLQLSVPEVARTLLSSSLFIGNDSGVSHLAGLLDVPAISLFGKSNPKVWKPLGKRTITLGDRNGFPSLQEVLSYL